MASSSGILKIVNTAFFLKRQASTRGQKPALIFRNTAISFRDLHRRSCHIRGHLMRMGIGKGDKVALIFANGLEFAYLYYALEGLGAVIVPVDHRLGGPELRALCDLCEIKMAWVAPDYGHVRQLQEWTQVQPWEDRFLQSSSVSFDACQPKVGSRSESILMLHTSGTTGMPKVVELTRAHMNCAPESMHTLLATSGEEVIAMILPMSHISGPIMLNEIVDKGSTLVIFDQIHPKALFQAIERYKISLFHGVPPLFQMILNSPERTLYDLGSLRVLAMMGTAVPESLMKKVQEALPHVALLQGYGLTETSPFITMTPIEEAGEHLSSIGKPVSGAEVLLIDDHGHAVPCGEVGELTVKGSMVMKGYYKNPEATAQRIRNDFLYTGDMARCDTDGFYYHLGRKDDMIVTGGGLNVYPSEVENLLLIHPDVAEAAVMGIDAGDHKGTVLHAFIVAKNSSNVEAESLRDHLRERLATFKIPRHYHMLAEMPKNSTGKIVKAKLAGSFLKNQST